MKRILLSAAALVLIVSCRKDTGANWDVDVTLPLVKSELSIRNFLGDSVFKAGQDGLLSLSIRREILTLKLDSLMRLPDTNIVSPLTYTENIAIPLEPGNWLQLAPSEIVFTPGNGASLKRLKVRTGKLHVKFSNNVPQSIDLVYKLNEVTKDGKPFAVEVTVPTGSNTLDRTYDLAGYTFNLRGPKGNKYNTINQTYSVALSAGSASLMLQKDMGARVELTYSEITPDYVEGYFGQEVVKLGPDTAQFELISNFSASNFLLHDARMEFRIENEVGADFSGSISNIVAMNERSAQSSTLTGTQLQRININRARVQPGYEAITPGVKSISFDKTNSNITSFISTVPNSLSYVGSVTLNPLQNVSGYSDFAYYNTGIRIFADIDIPMRFNADHLELTSDAAVNFSSVEQLKKINDGRFVISVNNGYPFDAVLQAYMLDAQGAVIDSLFEPGSNKIGHGLLDANNEIISALRSNVYMQITRSKIDNLQRCKSLRVRSRFVMPPNPPDIKLYERYQLDMNIVAEVSYNAGVRTN